jgi:cell division protease FtsH
LPNNSALQNRIYSLLARSKADISTITEPTDYMSHIATGCFAVLPFVYLALVYRMMNRQVGGDDSTGTKGIVRGKHNNDRNVVTFRDVAGIDSVVEEVREVVDYLKNPSRYHQVGATTPSGVLVGTRTWRR